MPVYYSCKIPGDGLWFYFCTSETTCWYTVSIQLFAEGFGEQSGSLEQELESNQLKN